MFINKENSLQAGGRVNAAAHEFLHGVLFKSIGKDAETQTALGDAVIEYVQQNKGGFTPKFRRRMEPYNRDSEYGEEIITIMSESIMDGSMPYNENLFTKLGDIIRQNLQRLGLRDITFNTGEDVYNFIKDYNASIEKNYDSIAIEEMMDKGAKGELLRKKKKTKAPEGIMASKEASDKVQSIYEEQGEAGAFEIIEQFKPIVSRIAERRREAPNFDKELLMSEIEIGERGILDLISKYDPDSGVPLAAYINKFLPSRAIEASRRVLGEEFTEDISERVDIAAEEVEVETTTMPKKKKIVLSDRLGVTDKVSKAIEKLIPTLKLDDLNFKTLKNQIPEIIGELFGISPKKLISGANITKAELQAAQMFISKNADVLLAMLPEGATVSGTATGVPNTLLKPFYAKTSRAKMAKTGTKAGLAIQVKKENISKSDFLEVFGIVDGVPNRTDRNTSARVLALANQTGKMITNQAVRQQLGEANIEAKETINRLRDGKSKVMFAKNEYNLSEVTDGNFKDLYVHPLGTLSEIHGIELASKKDFYRTNSKGQRAKYRSRDLDANFSESETYREAGSRVINTFVEGAPQFRELIKITMTGGLEGGFFQTVGNFNDLINKTDVKQEYIGRKKYSGKGALYSKNYHESINKKEFKDQNDARLPQLLSFFKAVEAHLQNFPEDVWMFEEMLLDTGKQQNVLTRILAPFAFYAVDGDGNTIFDQEIKEEHTDPQNLIGKALLAGAVFSNVDKVWKVVGKSYMQGAILDSKLNPHDKMIDDAGLSNKMPDVYYEKIVPRLLSGELKLPNGYSSIVRLAVAGIDLNMYKLAAEGVTIAEYFGVEGMEISEANQLVIDQLAGEATLEYAKAINKANIKPQLKENKTLNNAIVEGRMMASKPARGITVLDFDDTLATSKSLIRFTKPDGTTGTLNAEQYASTYEELTELGYKWDFSEFNKVVGGKIAPLFQKALKLQGKFGAENMFVLTARPPQAAKAIFDFLKANGLNIPIKNITGLGNSTAEAKANWMAGKVSEGYNDFYFADDALQNVKAVDNMLEQFDVKRKVQQARIKFSKSMNKDFNDILENVTDIASDKRFSAIKARKRGAEKGKFRVFIPPSHEDFVGLLYNFMGKGKEGNNHRDFFETALVKPLNRAYKEIDAAKQAVANDFKELNKQFPEVKDKLIKDVPSGDFTYQDAIRVYLWNKHSYKIPGLSTTDQQSLVELVNQDAGLKAYAETLNVISKQETYVDPGPNWNTGNIRIDLVDATGRVGRKAYFAEFNKNAEVLFSEENLNKIEAAYGSNFRSALEDMLHRIKTGVNRPKGASAKPNMFMNWLNASVAGVMFFNTRSALLQQMSNVNYLNFADNNIYAAGKAFANQKQYWKDFAMIFNSDMMKQRRGGLQTDINGAELAEAIKKARPGNVFDQVAIITGKALKLGFLPTQIGDNIAIATGGAAFYRNRVNKYIKDGMSIKDAEAAAFTDFQNITQSTQQSARPDMTSQQQASWIGKLVLNFLNTPSQYNRIIKKAGSDIKNRRITPPNTSQTQSDMSNMSRILYYGAAQNLIFYSLQTALFAVMFGSDDEDDDKRAEQFLKKKERVIQGTIDTILRGSGIYGVAISTLKNMTIKFIEQREKGYNKDESAVLMEGLNFSPVLGIKARRIVNAEKTLNYNKKVIAEMETLDIDNPVWSAVTNIIQATTGAPLNKMYQKTINLRNAMDSKYTAFQRALFLSGYTTWSLNLGDTEKMKQIKQDVKDKTKAASKEKSKIKREEKKKVDLKEKEVEGIEKQKKEKKEGKQVTCLVCKLPIESGKKYCTVHEKTERRKDGKEVQCRKRKKDGKRCGMKTTSKSGYCYYHD